MALRSTAAFSVKTRWCPVHITIADREFETENLLNPSRHLPMDGQTQPLSQNNRRAGWGYDADGRNTTVGSRTNTFDAAGLQTSMSATAIPPSGSSYTVNQAFSHDGDGMLIKEVDTQS